MAKSSGVENVTLKTFLKWDFNADFLYEVDDESKITRLQCKVCSQHIAAIRNQAKIRGITGQSFQSIINYVDGVNYVHKGNVTRHVKSGSLHDWAKKKFCTNPSDTTTPTLTDTQTTVASTSAQPQSRTLQGMFTKGAKEQYRSHFVTALAIVRKERPMSDFMDLVDLQKKNGVKFVTGKCDSKTCREMVNFLAKALIDDVGDILAKCNFFACEQDGSEARKTRDEKELVYVKLSIRGKPVELLLKCQRMTDFGGVSAASIKLAIDEAFHVYKINADKYIKCLVSACADGAAVNLGRLNGALTVLKQERPWLLIIHCSAHRIELAVQDAFKESGEFEKINEMMLNLHLFFRNSGKSWRILLHVADRLGVTLQRFPKASGTRFQVHKYRALKVLIVNFLPLCLFAENMLEAGNKVCDSQQKAKLRGYLNQWLSYQYLASLHFYRLVLRQTSHLSYICQDASRLVTEVIHEMKSCDEELQSVVDSEEDLPFEVEIEGDSVNITAVATNFPSNQRFKDQNKLTAKQQKKAEKYTTVINESYEVKRVRQGKDAVKRIKDQLIPSIATHIKDRMKSFDDNIFSAFKIADHSQWDFSNKDYGIPEVKTIASHFKDSLEFHNFSLDIALLEWRALKKLVNNKFQHFTNNIALWHQIAIHHQEKFPHILLIIELVLITPYSSASVERGFSLMSRLLTNTRLNMTNSTLNDLMLLRVNFPILCSLDPDYEKKLVEKATRLYVEDKQRRTSRKRPASTGTDSQRPTTSDTFLPIPISSVLTTVGSDLTRDEDFLVLDSEESDTDCDTQTDSCSSSDEIDSDSEL